MTAQIDFVSPDADPGRKRDATGGARGRVPPRKRAASASEPEREQLDLFAAPGAPPVGTPPTRSTG